MNLEGNQPLEEALRRAADTGATTNELIPSFSPPETRCAGRRPNTWHGR